MSFKVGSVCAVSGCNNYKQQKESKSFFRMPKDKDRLKKWIIACKRKDLDEMLKFKTPEYFYNSYTVCSDHFEITCFRNENLLSQGLWPSSLPTLKLFNAPIKIKRECRNAEENFSSSKKTPVMEDINTSTPVLDEVEELRKQNIKLQATLEEYKKKLHKKTVLISKYKLRNKLLNSKLKEQYTAAVLKTLK